MDNAKLLKEAVAEAIKGCRAQLMAEYVRRHGAPGIGYRLVCEVREDGGFSVWETRHDLVEMGGATDQH